jgi:DNA polymerase phi
VFSDEITETGLLDMLRVVKIDMKGSRRQTDSDDDEDDPRVGIEDDDDEMEDADAGNVDDATDELDEEMDDDSADEVDQDQDDLEKTVDNKAKGDDTEATKDGEDSDDSDGMDDDAMFRIDPYIARIFQERKNLPGSETQQSQLMRFKFRVLTLLEIYLQRNPGIFNSYIFVHAMLCIR